MSRTLTEADLRDAKDAMMEGVAIEAKRLGAVPSGTCLENWTAPIVEKIARDAEAAPAPPSKVTREELEDVTRGNPLVAVDFKGAEHKVRTLDPRALPKKETPRQEANRWMVERINRDPEMAGWRADLLHLMQKPMPGHAQMHCAPCGGGVCQIRETAIGCLLVKFADKYGDPIHAVMRKRAGR